MVTNANGDLIVNIRPRNVFGGTGVQERSIGNYANSSNLDVYSGTSAGYAKLPSPFYDNRDDVTTYRVISETY